MIRVGPYTFHRDTLQTISQLFLDGMRVRFFGIPRLQYKNLLDLAAKVLRQNLIDSHMLSAGTGHFKLMWVADTAMAFGGLRRVFPRKTLRNIIQHIIDASVRKGYVTAGFSNRRAIDIPYHRADSLPWLLYMCDQYAQWCKDTRFIKKNRASLQTLISAYEKEVIGDDGFVKTNIHGDWADTIRRPSSSWNNLMAIYTLRFAKKYHFTLRRIPKNLPSRLLAQRLKRGRLLDYAGSKQPSVDGAILALYLGLFTKPVRLQLARFLQHTIRSQRFSPIFAYDKFPKNLETVAARLGAYGYHTLMSWVHLELMMINGYKKLGLQHEEGLRRIEALTEKYGNFVETVTQKGEVFKAIMASEYGFTMSAGQYIEAASDTV